MKNLKLLFFLIAPLLAMSCNKEDVNNDKPVQVGFYLTDAPSLNGYSAVDIDVKSIEYNINEGDWLELPITPTSIELLQFNNGLDTLLSNVMLNSGDKITQIRLKLGENNKLTLSDNSVVDLKVPSGETSGLKINVQSVADITSGYRVIIDFDAERSIVAKGNGSFSLKPVVRAYIDANTSSIYGTISPTDVSVRVFTVVGNDTISTISDVTNGNRFKLHGLFTGTYKIEAQDLVNLDISTIKDDVNVIGGTDVNLGEIIFN